MAENLNYKYGGAKALVELHEINMYKFAETWRKAKKLDIKLPETDDEYYKSLEMLLFHLLNSSGNYMKWICKVLNLPNPGIDPAPKPEVIEKEHESYLKNMLDKWKYPLINIEHEAFYSPEYPSRWETKYCIDAMLEHAVMHPIRHAYQLEKLIKEQK